MMIRTASLVLSLLAHATALLYFSSASLPQWPDPASPGNALRLTVLHAGESSQLSQNLNRGNRPIQPRSEAAAVSVEVEIAGTAHSATPPPVSDELPMKATETMPPPAVEVGKVASLQERQTKKTVLQSLQQSGKPRPAIRRQVASRKPARDPKPSAARSPRVESEGESEVTEISPAVPANAPTSEPGSSRPPAISSQQLLAIERNYATALLAAIEKRKRYPLRARRRGDQGEVRVQFTIQRDGTISQVQVASSSSSQSLDRAASGAVISLGRFDPIPPQLDRDRWEFQVPIRFAMK